MGRSVLIAGATGLVGRRLLSCLLDDPDVGSVVALTRRPLSLPHPKLHEAVVDFAAGRRLRAARRRRLLLLPRHDDEGGRFAGRVPRRRFPAAADHRADGAGRRRDALLRRVGARRGPALQRLLQPRQGRPRSRRSARCRLRRSSHSGRRCSTASATRRGWASASASRWRDRWDSRCRRGTARSAPHRRPRNARVVASRRRRPARGRIRGHPPRRRRRRRRLNTRGRHVTARRQAPGSRRPPRTAPPPAVTNSGAEAKNRL